MRNVFMLIFFLLFTNVFSSEDLDGVELFLYEHKGTIVFNLTNNMQEKSIVFSNYPMSSIAVDMGILQCDIMDAAGDLVSRNGSRVHYDPDVLFDLTKKNIELTYGEIFGFSVQPHVIAFTRKMQQGDYSIQCAFPKDRLWVDGEPYMGNILSNKLKFYYP